MVTRNILLAGAVVAAAAASNLSCGADCGPGTIAQDGQCVPADDNPSNAHCGMGTKLGPQGTCIPDPPTVCDPDTTTETVDPDTGVVTCTGTGGSGPLPCSNDIPCPAPTGTKITLCGRLYDSQSDAPVPPATDATGLACGAGGSTTNGPCLLQMKFYDAVEFANNPSGATEIIPASFHLDDCGRYSAQNMNPPQLTFVGVGVDDASGSPDTHRLTGVATANATSRPARDFRAYSTKITTDTMWSTTANIGAPSFATRGVLAAVFRYHGTPRSGVQILRNNSPIASDDFYFSDTDIQRTTIAPAQNTTGANGTALVLYPGVPGPTNYEGMGNEPAGCAWPENLGAAIPSVVFMQLKDATTTATSNVLCP